MIIGITSEETLCVVDDSRTLFHYNFSLKPVEMQIKTSHFLIAARFLIFPDVVQGNSSIKNINWSYAKIKKKIYIN